MFLGVDGGGSKTAFVLADARGRVLASHREGSLYHPEVGIDGVLATLRRGAGCVAREAAVPLNTLGGVWIGLPAHGEDSRLQARLDALPSQAFPGTPASSGNDLECAHAGALGGADGISLVSGTGSMAWGTWQGRSVRCGGWGELFGDEGSAYWIAREGLALFSRMSDGRAERGALYDIIRERTAIESDLDLSGRVIGGARSAVASYAVSVHEAALAADPGARAILHRAARELASLVSTARHRLGVPVGATVVASTSGSVVDEGSLVLQELRQLLGSPEHPGPGGAGRVELRAPLMVPVLGAVALAARTAGCPLSEEAIGALVMSQALRE